MTERPYIEVPIVFPNMDYPLTSVEALPDHEVLIWLLKDNGPSISPDFLVYLDAEEYNRYKRMVAPGKQRQFLMGRILLKRILGQYLERKPENIRLLIGKNWKPGI